MLSTNTTVEFSLSFSNSQNSFFFFLDVLKKIFFLKIGAYSFFTDALSSLISPRIIIGFEISCLFLNCFCFI